MPTNKQWDIIKWENQFRKDKSIAYFNSVNAAIQKQQGKKWDWDLWEKDRNKFYQKWQEWYFEQMPKPQEDPREDLLEDKIKDSAETDAARTEAVGTEDDLSIIKV